MRLLEDDTGFFLSSVKVQHRRFNEPGVRDGQRPRAGNGQRPCRRAPRRLCVSDYGNPRQAPLGHGKVRVQIDGSSDLFRSLARQPLAHEDARPGVGLQRLQVRRQPAGRIDCHSSLRRDLRQHLCDGPVGHSEQRLRILSFHRAGVEEAPGRRFLRAQVQAEPGSELEQRAAREDVRASIGRHVVRLVGRQLRTSREPVGRG